MPATPPVRKAMRIALTSPPSSLAAAATRTLPRTASHMPVYPVIAEKTAPTRKKIERPTFSDVVSAGRRNSRKKTSAAKTDRVRNWRDR